MSSKEVSRARPLYSTTRSIRLESAFRFLDAPWPFAASWLVAHSAHEAASAEIGPDGPPAGAWDFAVVRLAEPVGMQAIGPDPHAKDVDKRGRYMLDGN